MKMLIPDFDLVLFGGTGDLSLRKLLPALFARFRAGDFPDSFRLICVGHRAMKSEEFIQLVTEQCSQYIPQTVFELKEWQKFCAHMSYLGMDARAAESYVTLRQLVRPDVVRVFYLSTPPALFLPICENLRQSDMINPEARVVLEKPLGHNLETARRINAEVGSCFSEDQIFRIDHYLGKEAVQNLLALRFGNVLFEPLWRREWVQDVQITIAEDIGVGTRAGFYEGAGALRDMLQNHLLQLLCIIAMEPPLSIAPDAVRDEKLKVLKALQKFDEAAVAQKTVRGQYRKGVLSGKPVPGYLEEPGVAAESRTETYVAMVAEINTWRWNGVPFFLRTGKRMAERRAEILVRFKDVPHSIFSEHASHLVPNHLLISLQPDEGVSLGLMAKTPGDGIRLHPVELGLDFAEAFKKPRMDAYERLLLDVLRGQLTLFMRGDELEAAWNWVDPVLGIWSASADEPRPYSAGTWGPPAASALLSRYGSQWREEI